MKHREVRSRSRQSTAPRKAVETAALWKLWKNPSKEGRYPLVIFPRVPTALGKLSAKNNCAESFPQFPQLRRLGSFTGRRTVSTAVTRACAVPSTPELGCLDVTWRAVRQESKPRALPRRSLFLTDPFHRTPNFSWVLAVPGASGTVSTVSLFSFPYEQGGHREFERLQRLWASGQGNR